MFFTLILGGSGRLLAFFAGGQGKNSKKSATCTTGFCVHWTCFDLVKFLAEETHPSHGFFNSRFPWASCKKLIGNYKATSSWPLRFAVYRGWDTTYVTQFYRYANKPRDQDPGTYTNQCPWRIHGTFLYIYLWIDRTKHQPIHGSVHIWVPIG